MIRAITSPPLDDVLQLYADSAGLKPRIKVFAMRVALLQSARSECLGYVDDAGRLVAAVMLYPLDPEKPDEDLRELVFCCRPEASAHIGAIVRHARLIASRLAQSDGLRIRATVKAGHLPGQRLARLIGMTAAGFGADGFEHWEWTPSHEQRRQIGHPIGQAAIHRRAVARTGGSAGQAG
jgi:hypothetical protein